MTTIEWVKNRDGSSGRSWNPVRGCTRASEGCRNCYAEGIAARFSGPGQPYEGIAEMRDGRPRWTGKLTLATKALLEPLRRRKPTTYFVNSMSDLFHGDMPDEWIDRVFAVMALCPQHIFQVLTKRPERMRAYMTSRSARDKHGYEAEDIRVCMTAMVATPSRREAVPALRTVPQGKFCKQVAWPLPNVWLGTSCEDQPTADERVPELLATPAAVRFVSAEPLLGPIDYRRWIQIDWQCSCCREFFTGRHKSVCLSCDQEGGWSGSHAFNGHLQPKRTVIPIDRGSGLDWIIAGGESGPRARPMHPAWAREIRDQCATAGVPFFFKQRGEWSWLQDSEGEWPTDAGSLIRLTYSGERHDGGYPMQRVGKKHAGRLLDGRTHDDLPEVQR